jgi:hypothetical protein
MLLYGGAGGDGVRDGEQLCTNPLTYLSNEYFFKSPFAFLYNLIFQSERVCMGVPDRNNLFTATTELNPRVQLIPLTGSSYLSSHSWHEVTLPAQGSVLFVPLVSSLLLYPDFPLHQVLPAFNPSS